ncbi:MAG: hypothetical protein RR403_01185 [Pseudoflavonifractor sp.]
MTTIEIEEKLSGLFHHGEILEREVRLTPQEIARLRQGDGSFVLLDGDRDESATSPSAWYKVQFKGAFLA